MFKKILIASDLSPASDCLIACMKGFRSVGVEEVILFYALGISHLDSLKYLIEDSVKPALIKQQNTIKKEGFNTTLEIAPGIPSEEIKRVAQEKDVSLIVIGSHGESAAYHPLFAIGRVTSEVLHSHQKPLLLIKTKMTDQQNNQELQEIVENAINTAKVYLFTFYKNKMARTIKLLSIGVLVIILVVFI